MFFYNSTFTLLGLAGLFVSSIIFIACIVIEVKLTKKSFAIGSTIQGLVVQIISGIAKIRVAGAEGRFFNVWGNLFSQKKKIDLKLQLVGAIERLAYRIFPMVMTSILFWAAIVIFRTDPTMTNNLTPSHSLGAFIGFYTAYALLIVSVLEIFQMLFSIYGVTPYWERSKLIVQEDTEKKPQTTAKIKLKGGVALEHVYFRYEKEGNWVLQDVSIVAHPGEMVAIVGPTGCGKSTIVRLLLGFESPEQGEVLYDERDIAEYDIRSIRQQIGTVLQNEGLLGGSIYENIVGAKTYAPEAIEKALQLSGFDEDLKTLPMGLHTIMTMGGNTISGGQRQRVYLARALVSSPKILIMDEATSALDSKSQERVGSNLDQLNVTRIVIAHRLSTIRHADRIYVMEDGKIVESGTFKELEEANGLFTAMLKRQQL
jgi:ABC-type bacteriocin/lantibiotic exporter with double-glycine peptidase domain